MSYSEGKTSFVGGAAVHEDPVPRVPRLDEDAAVAQPPRVGLAARGLPDDPVLLVDDVQQFLGRARLVRSAATAAP